jgi:hypothetical protein
MAGRCYVGRVAVADALQGEVAPTIRIAGRGVLHSSDGRRRLPQDAPRTLRDGERGLERRARAGERRAVLDDDLRAPTPGVARVARRRRPERHRCRVAVAVPRERRRDTVRIDGRQEPAGEARARRADLERLLNSNVTGGARRDLGLRQAGLPSHGGHVAARDLDHRAVVGPVLPADPLVLEQPLLELRTRRPLRFDDARRHGRRPDDPSRVERLAAAGCMSRRTRVLVLAHERRTAAGRARFDRLLEQTVRPVLVLADAR